MTRSENLLSYRMTDLAQNWTRLLVLYVLVVLNDFSTSGNTHNVLETVLKKVSQVVKSQ